MTATLPVKIDRGDGQPLVLIHGLGNTYESWQYVLEHIDLKKWRVIVIDLLGFGDAPKPNLRYTPEEHVQSIKATLDEIKVGSAVLAGHSMGAIIAIEYAHTWPENVKKIVLFGAPLYKKTPKGTWLDQITHSDGLYFRIFKLVKNNPKPIQAGGEIADEFIPFVKGLEITEATWPAYASSLEHTIMQFETLKKASHLKVPMLFINGLFDFFILRKNIKELKQKNRSFVTVKNTLGPHEITPKQGKSVASIIQRMQ